MILFTKAYIPIPERSGYDESGKVFSSFATSLKSDYNVMANAVFNDVGREVDDGQQDPQPTPASSSSSSSTSSTVLTHLPPLPPIVILFRIRTEIVETIELLAPR